MYVPKKYQETIIKPKLLRLRRELQRSQFTGILNLPIGTQAFFIISTLFELPGSTILMSSQLTKILKEAFKMYKMVTLYNAQLRAYHLT